MDEKQKEEQLKEGLDQLEHVNIDELAESDLDGVAGGTEASLEEDVAFCSLWDCSSSG
jgi:hypothetical protein